jgi:Transglutaminase-like superfamily
VRRQLDRLPVDRVRVRRPPSLPARAGRGVDAVLRRLEPSCLERALVLQRWLAARGDRRDVIIGVTAPGDGFRAHAWLEGENGSSFTEIARVGP